MSRIIPGIENRNIYSAIFKLKYFETTQSLRCFHSQLIAGEVHLPPYNYTKYPPQSKPTTEPNTD